MAEGLSGIDAGEFDALVRRGLARPDATVTGDEAIEALGDTDPTPEAIERLRTLLIERGVVLDDAVPNDSDIDVVEEVVIIAHDPLLDDLEDDDLVERRLRARFRPSTKATMRLNASSTGTAAPLHQALSPAHSRRTSK